ncbi:MAG: hypothetical protein ACO294_09385 [Methylococcales bacterium]
MRAKEFIAEIEPIARDAFIGGSKALWSKTKAKIPGLKPVPGMGSEFGFSVSSNPSLVVIEIYVKEKDGRFRNVAALSIYPAGSNFPFKNAYMVSYITTHEGYRGQGLASKLYELYFRYVGKILLSGLQQTPGGQRNWVSMFKSDNLAVYGLTAIKDHAFTADKSRHVQLNRHIQDLMNIGAEYVGTSERGRKHWFRVPLRRDRNRLEVLRNTSNVKMYSKNELETLSVLMATWAGNK